jgi:hypothetical protein
MNTIASCACVYVQIVRYIFHDLPRPEGKVMILNYIYRSRLKQVLYIIQYMASITSGEMACCDWLRSTFSTPLFFRNDRRSTT